MQGDIHSPWLRHNVRIWNLLSLYVLRHLFTIVIWSHSVLQLYLNLYVCGSTWEMIEVSNAKASLSLLSSNVVAIIQKYHTGKMTAVFHVFDGGGHALFDGFPQTLLEWKIEFYQILNLSILGGVRGAILYYRAPIWHPLIYILIVDMLYCIFDQIWMTKHQNCSIKYIKISQCAIAQLG